MGRITSFKQGIYMSKGKFIKIYSSLPDNIRKEIIVVIDGKPYTWDVAYIEVYKDTALGKRIIEKLQKMGLIEND